MKIRFFAYAKAIFCKIIPMLLLVAFLLPAPLSAADENNGAALLERCKSVNKIGSQGVVLKNNETNNLMFCLGYFSGFMGMYKNTASLDNFKTTPYCAPQDVNWKPLARIVVGFLEKNPELMQQPQEDLTVMALSEAFPCSDTK